ncbi:hypothetical protein, partial [Merdimonas faecis]
KKNKKQKQNTKTKKWQDTSFLLDFLHPAEYTAVCQKSALAAKGSPPENSSQKYPLIFSYIPGKYP